MAISPEQFTLSAMSIRLMVLLVVILVERYISLSPVYHPANVLRYIALQLATKVNRRSPKQQRASGIISAIILASLVMAIAVAILSFARYPWFFEAIILLLALNSRGLLQQSNKIANSLTKGHKTLAREQLNTICLRDSTTLSSMGIIKATIEGVVQRVSQSYFNILWCYALFGIYGAIVTALINALAHYWNPKKAAYRQFGRAISALAGWLNHPVQLLLALNIAIVFGFKHLSGAKVWHRKGSGVLLNTTANAMRRELGGAVMYDGIKIRRPKLGTSQLPVVDDLAHLNRLVLQLANSSLAIFTLALATSLLLNNF